MKFCPGCGSNVEGMKFCGNCGKALGEEFVAPIKEALSGDVVSDEKILLEFTTYMFGLEGKSKGAVSIPTENYKLTTERMLIEKQGIITKTRDEIELYKIKDIVVKQKLKDKMMNVGDIEIISSDESTPSINLKRIKDPLVVKEAIRNASRNAKIEVGVSYRQNI